MRTFCFGMAFAALVALVGCGGGGGGASTGPAAPLYGSVTGAVYTASTAGVSKGKLAVRAVTATRASGDQPIGGATVAISGLPSLTTTTDGTGSFLLKNVPSGPQTVIISSSGYATLSVPVTVNPGSTPTNVTPPLATTAQYQWTVLVYMDAENDLEAYGLQNCMQMEQVGSTSQVATLVEFGRPNPHYSDPLITSDATVNGEWSGVRRYLITKATNPNETAMHSTLLQDMGSSVTGSNDMGNPQTLSAFITWGETYAPAQHYLVVLWDHGSGWDPEYDLDTSSKSTRMTARAICVTDSGSGIRDVDLPTALAAQNPIDIVATDACLMAMGEVAYEIRNQAQYLVASEEETPVNGLPYTDILSNITSQPSSTPATFAKYIAHDAFTSWNNLGYTVATSSAIDLSKIGAVATALAPFTSRLIAQSGTYSTALNTAFNCERFSPDSGSVFADLTDYAYHFYDPRGIYAPAITTAQDSQIQPDAQALESAISNAVIGTDTGSGHPNAHGMSIYFPGKTVYTNPNYGYEGIPASTSYPPLTMNAVTDWDQWLLTQPTQ